MLIIMISYIYRERESEIYRDIERERVSFVPARSRLRSDSVTMYADAYLMSAYVSVCRRVSTRMGLVTCVMCTLYTAHTVHTCAREEHVSYTILS